MLSIGRVSARHTVNKAAIHLTGVCVLFDCDSGLYDNIEIIIGQRKIALFSKTPILFTAMMCISFKITIKVKYKRK